MNVIHYILFILFFLIVYSISFKTIEGFDDEFYYYNKLIDYKTIPNSYVNDSIPSRIINKFGFYKGKGTFKKGYSKETKTDEKISTLNKLLNKLLGIIVSDNQDCVGSFGKYSECDKSCGSNSFQTRKYNITQERGKNGKDCPFVDGYEEKLRCNLDECQLGDICENNADCGTGNCNPKSTRCENMVPCSINNAHVCNETQCINLNKNNNNDNKMIDGTYIYNNVDKECFFKTPAEIEKLNLNEFTYDYRTLSQKVRNLELECDYFQVKKDGVGPCINASNIIMDGDIPKCILGYGPEPTMFNGSYACSECIIPGHSDDGCYCKDGKILDSSGQCIDDATIQSTNNLCPEGSDELWFIKRKTSDSGCAFCPVSYQFRKSGSDVSCVRCPEGANTFTNNCLSTTCDKKYYKNKLFDTYGNIVDIDNITSDIDYYEKCFTNTESTVESSICRDNQIPLGSDNKCICNGDGMNLKQPGCDSDDCENPQTDCNASNCLPGYVFNNTNNSCSECEIPENCLTHDEDSCRTDNKKYNCTECNIGYELDAAGECSVMKCKDLMQSLLLFTGHRGEDAGLLQCVNNGGGENPRWYWDGGTKYCGKSKVPFVECGENPNNYPVCCTGDVDTSQFDSFTSKKDFYAFMGGYTICQKNSSCQNPRPIGPDYGGCTEEVYNSLGSDGCSVCGTNPLPDDIGNKCNSCCYSYPVLEPPAPPPAQTSTQQPCFPGGCDNPVRSGSDNFIPDPTLPDRLNASCSLFDCGGCIVENIDRFTLEEQNFCKTCCMEDGTSSQTPPPAQTSTQQSCLNGCENPVPSGSQTFSTVKDGEPNNPPNMSCSKGECSSCMESEINIINSNPANRNFCGTCCMEGP